MFKPKYDNQRHAGCGTLFIKPENVAKLGVQFETDIKTDKGFLVKLGLRFPLHIRQFVDKESEVEKKNKNVVKLKPKTKGKKKWI